MNKFTKSDNKKELVLVFILFFAVISGLIWVKNYLRQNKVVVHAQAQSDNDWPMYMHDPQHTGATSTGFSPTLESSNCQLTGSGDISPCLQIRWKKSFSEWPNTGLFQPIVYGTTVFFANMDGKLHAYDVETGNENWVFDAGSAIAVSPAVAENKIFFGDFLGKIYGLSITNKSQIFSPIQTGRTIYSSPTVIRENNILKVFIGSNDGKLYCINGETGVIIFSFDTGSYIYSSPAFFNGKVFVAAENMMAYALNSNNGNVVWSKKLDGESNRGDHPVVASVSNTVLFHTVPRFGDTGHGLKDRFKDLNYALSWYEGISKTLEQILPQYQSEVLAGQGLKSMFLFNADTGQEVNSFTVGTVNLQMIPLNTWYANGQNAPLVLDNKDLIFGAFGGYVRLDTKTRIFSTILAHQPVRGDEYTSLTLANGWLYGGYMANIIRFSINGVTAVLHGCKDCGDPPPYQPFDLPISGNHWGGYTGDGYTDLGSYFVIANNNRAFYSANGWFYAF